jgi:hypothetical protein
MKWIYLCYVEESIPPLWSSGQSSWLQNGDVLFFLWGTNWIYICYAEDSILPLWSSGQSSWLQIHIFWEVVGLERGLLRFVSTIEELFERKSSFSGLESREYGSMDPSRWPRGTIYPQKLTLSSPTSVNRSVNLVRPQTRVTEFVLSFVCEQRQKLHVDWKCKLKSQLNTVQGSAAFS